MVEFDRWEVLRFWLCFLAANIYCQNIFCGACESWRLQKFDIVVQTSTSLFDSLYFFGLTILRIQRVFIFGRTYFGYIQGILIFASVTPLSY